MATTTPSAAELANDISAMAAYLRVSATRLARRLRQESDAGLTPSQHAALVSVEKFGPLTLGALAEYERVAPPSITKVVAKLEGVGYVERRPDESDRRMAWVSITATGRAHLARVRQRKNLWLAARLADLDDDQRQRLASALDVLDVLTADSP
jgi:DNA-binding MarR family transcriptional regulator